MQSNNNVPRPARHLKEKYRREQMKRLYRRLASLISAENSLKTSPAFDVLDQATKYIKQLENKVNDLKARKDFLQQPIEIDVNESETGETLEINIVCGPENKKLKMHELFQILKEEGAEVVSATNNTVDLKIYHTILCKKTSPAFDVLDQATKYIKQLENNINDLKARKDFLQLPIEIDVNESETGETLEINIVCGPENKKLKMHKIFQILKEEGAEVVSATNNTVDLKMYHTILCKAFTPRLGMDTNRVKERLNNFISNK